MKNILYITAIITILAGCDKQRDLYDTSSPLLQINGDWKPSLGIAQMNASTAMLYKNDVATRWLSLTPNIIKPRVSAGEYDVLLFNGMMFDENDPNLDGVFFRNTDNIDTFEAVANEAAPNSRITRQDSEYLASNDMEVIASARDKAIIEGESRYFLKYRNGHNGYPVPDDYIEKEISMVPRVLSYYTEVIVNLINPGSALSAAGSLRGFARSAFMASGEPSHLEATHQLKLNSLQITDAGVKDDPDNPERGTIRSPKFVSFGPPLDLPGRLYTFEITVYLKDGQVMVENIELPAADMNRITGDITDYRNGVTNVPPTITITVEVELPEVITGSAIIIDGWEDDEIITVKI